MYKFSRRSIDNLNTCHPDLQAIAHEAIKIYDFSVICGYRGEEEQNEAYNKGRSKLKYPQSKHNKKPALAFDIVPYPVNWQELPRFYEMAGVIKAIAHTKGIEIEWGGDWRTFKDYPHFQLKI